MCTRGTAGWRASKRLTAAVAPRSAALSLVSAGLRGPGPSPSRLRIRQSSAGPGRGPGETLGGRRSCSSSGSWARALAARLCVTGQAVLTAVWPAERRVGVGSAGVIAIGNAGRGGAGRGGGGAGIGSGDCGAPRQRGGVEASAEPAPRPKASGRTAGVSSPECCD